MRFDWCPPTGSAEVKPSHEVVCFQVVAVQPCWTVVLRVSSSATGAHGLISIQPRLV